MVIAVRILCFNHMIYCSVMFSSVHQDNKCSVQIVSPLSASIHLFKVNYRGTRTMYEICSKLIIQTTELMLNIFDTLFWCLHFWFSSCKYRVGQVPVSECCAYGMIKKWICWATLLKSHFGIGVLCKFAAFFQNNFF